MNKLYQIWRIVKNAHKPAPEFWPSERFVVVEGDNWAYPMIKFMDGLGSRWDRSDFINMDLAKLQETVNYFNFISCSDEHYEIREVNRED